MKRRFDSAAWTATQILLGCAVAYGTSAHASSLLNWDSITQGAGVEITSEDDLGVVADSSAAANPASMTAVSGNDTYDLNIPRAEARETLNLIIENARIRSSQ